MTGLTLVAIPSSQRSRIRDVWCALELTSSPTYFLSWSWVEIWLDTLPAAAPVTLYVARRGGAPIAAFFLGARTRWRHRVLPSRALHLNETGLHACDELCIEYNGMVHDGTPLPIAGILARLPGGWDELYLRAIDAEGALATALANDPAGVRARVRVDRRVRSPLVDLAKVRAAPDYLTLVSSNTRAQIRRARKLYTARGALAIEVAQSTGQALAILDELVALHRTAWAADHSPGAFSPFVHAFHRQLIQRRFDAHEIQLVRIRAGEATIGCLYNLVWRGTVAFYQSGFAYEADNRLKPGLVCHAAAIAHNAAAGHRWYDFLGGDSRYKESLATDFRQLVWLRLQQPRLRFLLEDAARAVRARLREVRAATERTPETEPAS